MKNHEKPTWNDEKPWKTTFPVLFPFFPLFFAKYFLKNQKYKFFLLARAIHREHFLLHCLKKEIATAKELDLRQLGKVLIFRDTHTEPSYYIKNILTEFFLLISNFYHFCQSEAFCSRERGDQNPLIKNILSCSVLADFKLFAERLKRGET